MINSQINITSVTIDAAIADAKLAICQTCNVTLPVTTGVCEDCA